MQHLDGDFTLEAEVARAIHAAEAARAQLLEQLVVVPQRAPQPPLEARVDDLRLRRGLVKRARVHHQILEHLRRGEITVARPGPQRAHQDALHGGGHRGAQLARRHQGRAVAGRFLAGERVIQVRADRIDVAGRLAHAACPHFGRAKRRRRLGRLGRLEGHACVRVAQIGDHAAPGHVEHQRRRHDAPDDDVAGMRVLERAQQVPRQRHDGGDGPRTAVHRVGQALAVDPVVGAIGVGLDFARGVHVADGGVVERRQRFRLAQEPGAAGRLGDEMQPQRDRPLEHEIVRVVQRALA